MAFTDHNVKAFGAIGDGITVSTAAIQAAIDVCHENGGGRVTVPSGVFLTGSIFLKSNVELHLSHGAVIKASEDLDDYNDLDAYPQNFGWAPEEWVGKHLILAIECENVALTGSGVIDGSASAFYEEPYLITGNCWREGNAMTFVGDKLYFTFGFGCGQSR